MNGRQVSWIAVMLMLGIARFAVAANIADTAETGGPKGPDADDDKVTLMQKSVVAGDNMRSTFKTGSNISAVSPGDVYANDTKSLFKVDRIVDLHGTDGGVIEIIRIAGNTNPDNKLTLVKSEKKEAPQEITAKKSVVDLFFEGGPFLYPIAVLALVTILLGFNCGWIYRKQRQCPQAFVEKARAALEEGDMEAFEDLALKEKGLFPYVCRAMANSYADSTPEDIERRCEVAAASRINKLRVPVRALNLISVAAPLLGLLGTIIGMIIVFEALANASGAQKAQALAIGIRVKLFSTASALMVAVPALFLFWIFNQVLGGIVAHCEVLAEDFVHQIRLLKRKGGAVPEVDGDDETPVKPMKKKLLKEASV